MDQYLRNNQLGRTHPFGHQAELSTHQVMRQHSAYKHNQHRHVVLMKHEHTMIPEATLVLPRG